MPFNSIFSWVMKKRLHQIELFMKYPYEVQNDVLEKLLTAGTQTEFGRTHLFDQIKTYEDFTTQVPLNDYESLKPYIIRSMENEQGLLWNQEVKWFAKSSGTTSDRSKFIPVTKDSLEDCHYKGGKDLLALYYKQFPNRKLYKGKHLIVGGSAQILPISHDMYQGDLSAIIVKNLPWWAEIRRTPSKEIALMTEWTEKIEKMALGTINEDVYIIAGVPSWTYVLAKKVLELTGKSNLREVWPNLELFMHGGINFEPYRELFRQLIPFDDMNYVETYNASEGFFGIQDNSKINELLLMLDYGIYYEFIPMDQFDGTNSKNVVPLENVEPNIDYAMVISTNGGLWRYIIGDTIKFTSKEPFRFRISGRTSHAINAFGEEVSVANTEKAISEAAKLTKATIREFTVAPIYMNEDGLGRHQWLIEFIQKPNDQNRFSHLVDETLRQINSDYDAKRSNNMAMLPPEIVVAYSGQFEDWLKSKGKLGGQHKVPRCLNGRDVMEQLLLLNESVKKADAN